MLTGYDEERDRPCVVIEEGDNPSPQEVIDYAGFLNPPAINWKSSIGAPRYLVQLFPYGTVIEALNESELRERLAKRQGDHHG